jgi:hypothetical protein
VTSKKARWLEHETLAYWEVSSATARSSRGRDAKAAREGIEDLHAHARYAMSARLRSSAERAIRTIADSPISIRSARRAAEAALADFHPKAS